MRPASCRDFTRDWLSGALPWPARLSRGERARFRWKATLLESVPPGVATSTAPVVTPEGTVAVSWNVLRS